MEPGRREPYLLHFDFFHERILRIVFLDAEVGTAIHGAQVIYLGCLARD